MRHILVHDRDLDVDFDVEVAPIKVRGLDKTAYELRLDSDVVGRIWRAEGTYAGWMDLDAPDRGHSPTPPIGYTMEEAVKRMVQKYIARDGKPMAQNPHQMAFDRKTEEYLGKVADAIYDRWRSTLYNSRSNLAVVKNIDMEQKARNGKPLAIEIIVTDDPKSTRRGISHVDTPYEENGFWIVPITLNMARNPSRSSVHETLRHEILHVVFAERARCDKFAVTEIVSSDPREQWMVEILAEPEFEARVLSFVGILVDKLQKTWKKDRRRAMVYAKEILSTGNSATDWAWLIKTNRDIIEEDLAESLRAYAGIPYNRERMLNALLYSIKEVVDSLEKAL